MEDKKELTDIERMRPLALIEFFEEAIRYGDVNAQMFAKAEMVSRWGT